MLENMMSHLDAPSFRITRCAAASSGWVQIPAHYDAARITSDDIEHDLAIRALTDAEVARIETAAPTTAQKIADRFGNDGQCWIDIAVGDTHLFEAIGAERNTRHHFGIDTVFAFDDGSAIAVTDHAWDVVGLVDGAWRSLEQDGSVNRNGWTFPVEA